MFQDVFIKNLAGYESYHLNPHNQMTHFVGIPMIVISVIWMSAWLPLGLEYAVFFGFIALWVAMDVAIGLILLAVFAPFFLIAVNWFQDLSFMTGNLWFWSLFILGWVFQLVGHVFEGRKPALVDNLFQGILGPMFLVYEVFVQLGLRLPLQGSVTIELDKLLAARANRDDAADPAAA